VDSRSPRGRSQWVDIRPGLSAEIILVHLTFFAVFFAFFLFFLVAVFCRVFVLVFLSFVLTGNDFGNQIEAGPESPVFLPGFSQLFT
jgi:hypothetical protein